MSHSSSGSRGMSTADVCKLLTCVACTHTTKLIGYPISIRWGGVGGGGERERERERERAYPGNPWVAQMSEVRERTRERAREREHPHEHDHSFIHVKIARRRQSTRSIRQKLHGAESHIPVAGRR